MLLNPSGDDLSYSGFLSPKIMEQLRPAASSFTLLTEPFVPVFEGLVANALGLFFFDLPAQCGPRSDSERASLGNHRAEAYMVARCASGVGRLLLAPSRETCEPVNLRVSGPRCRQSRFFQGPACFIIAVGK